MRETHRGRATAGRVYPMCRLTVTRAEAAPRLGSMQALDCIQQDVKGSMTPRRLHSWLSGLSALVVAVATSHDALAQICRPVSQRNDELGCWIISNAVVG